MKVDATSVVQELLNAGGVETVAVEEKNLAGQTVIAIEVAPTQLGSVSLYDVVHALDHLTKKIIESRAEDIESAKHFLVDLNDFRSRQIKELQTKALMMADRARSFQYDVELTPMSAYERLLVHATLADQPNIKTESQGEGKNRRVVIKYQA